MTKTNGLGGGRNEDLFSIIRFFAWPRNILQGILKNVNDTNVGISLVGYNFSKQNNLIEE